jgi:hypothetical protein
MKKYKFKFISREFWNDVVEEECYTKVDPPLPYKNLPDGDYMIRGDKKSHRKVYWKINDTWYLIDDVIKDNGHYMCDSFEYNLFPSLSEKEWNKIEAVGYKRLNPIWQRHLMGYRLWCDIRKQNREISLMFMKGEDDMKLDNEI